MRARGLGKVAEHPGILRAISPSYGISFLVDHGRVAFIALGSVVLTITGAEALYADMGHFGRSPIRRAWFAAVFPALVLNYMGQGALILDHAAARSTTRSSCSSRTGRGSRWSSLATVATVIASQAVISGAFSVTRQAVQLGFLPRLTIRHTSREEVGQVYVPAVNWGLFVAVVVLVVGFGSSAAPGLGLRHRRDRHHGDRRRCCSSSSCATLWRKPLWWASRGARVFLTVDLTFFSASLTKVTARRLAPPDHRRR